MMRWRLVVLGSCLATGTVLLDGATAWAGPKQPAPAAQCSWDFCVEDTVAQPAVPAGGQAEARPAGGGGPAPECYWAQTPPPGYDSSRGPKTYFELRGEQTATSSVIYEFCGGVFSGRMQWVEAATPTAPALPSPESLAQIVHVRLEGNLPAPEVSSDPGPGEAAIIRTPTFVRVENWTGMVHDQECDPTGLLCVSVTATPSLAFDPGEPSSSTLHCAGAGSRFDPAGPPSAVQAAASGTCAYAYALRTGVAGRPDTWQGQVTVTWDLNWSSTSGAGRTLPAIAKSADLLRAVNEVQTVVEE